MPKVIRVEENPQPFKYIFDCPGCGQYHGFTDSWKFNGNLELPTVSPSILVRWTEFTDEGKRQYDMDMKSGVDSDFANYPTKDMVCHFFIQNGRIQYLLDCTHELKGQTVDMLPISQNQELESEKLDNPDITEFGGEA